MTTTGHHCSDTVRTNNKMKYIPNRSALLILFSTSISSIASQYSRNNDWTFDTRDIWAQMTRDIQDTWPKSSYNTREQEDSRPEVPHNTRENNWSQLPQARVSNAEWLLSPVDTRVDAWHQSQSSSGPRKDRRDWSQSISSSKPDVDRRESQSSSEPSVDWALDSSSISRVWAELPQARVTRGSSYGDGYFQYLNVPAHKEYEFGWNRGNPKHFVSRYEQGKDHRFRTRVRWGDHYGGYGEQYYEYNHGDHGDQYQEHPPQPQAYSGEAPVIYDNNYSYNSYNRNYV